MSLTSINPVSTPQTPQMKYEVQMQEAADKLEAAFLAEMLKSAGFGQTPETFGGGSGEDQFSSFLVQAQAEKMVEAGGIGLSEQIFNALKEKSHGSS